MSDIEKLQKQIDDLNKSLQQFKDQLLYAKVIGVVLAVVAIAFGIGSPYAFAPKIAEAATKVAVDNYVKYSLPGEVETLLKLKVKELNEVESLALKARQNASQIATDKGNASTDREEVAAILDEIKKGQKLTVKTLVVTENASCNQLMLGPSGLHIKKSGHVSDLETDNRQLFRIVYEGGSDQENLKFTWWDVASKGTTLSWDPHKSVFNETPFVLPKQ